MSAAAKKTASNPFMDLDFTKFATDLKMPGMDMNGVIDFQKKNLEALTRAGQIAFDGYQAVAVRQAEILKNTMDELTRVSRELADNSGENPLNAAVKQTELAKRAYEDATANLKELTALFSKSQEEAAKTIQGRFAASLDELKAAIEKLAAAK